MTRDFHTIFACIAMGSTEDGDHCLVDDFIALMEVGVMRGVGWNSVAADRTDRRDGSKGISRDEGEDAGRDGSKGARGDVRVIFSALRGRRIRPECLLCR